MEDKPKRKQLIFDIDPKEHSLIKMDAARRGISINAWVRIALRRQLENIKT